MFPPPGKRRAWSSLKKEKAGMTLTWTSQEAQRQQMLPRTPAKPVSPALCQEPLLLGRRQRIQSYLQGLLFLPKLLKTEMGPGRGHLLPTPASVLPLNSHPSSPEQSHCVTCKANQVESRAPQLRCGCVSMLDLKSVG